MPTEPPITRWTIELPNEPGKTLRMSRLGRGLKNKDRDFDIAFWQAQDTSARMQAAWELVEHYLRQKGRESELRLQRNITKVFRGRHSLTQHDVGARQGGKNQIPHNGGS